MTSRRLFIHIPKTGGNTIQRSDRLKEILVRFGPSELGPTYVNALRAAMNQYGLNYQYEHCRWRDLQPEFTAKHQAVAIVRNPWSKVVSQYLFALKIDREHTHHPKNTTAVRAGTTFEQFIEIRHRWGAEPFFWHRTTVGWYPQVDHVTAEDGTLMCDVLRFEHHGEDVMRYFGLDAPMRRRNVTNVDGLDYRDFYTEQTRGDIEAWFAKDIEFFGFTFDGPATKHLA